MVDVPNIDDNKPVVGSALAQFVNQAVPVMDYDGFVGNTSTNGRVTINHALGLAPMHVGFTWVTHGDDWNYNLIAASTTQIVFQFHIIAGGAVPNTLPVSFNWLVIA